MAEAMEADARVSPEGRVVIPAAVRSVLGISAGDRVRFTVQDGEVRLVSARSLLAAVWANNDGGDAGNSVDDVRKVRTADRARVAAKWERVSDARAADARSEEAIEADVLAALGLAP